MYCCCPFRGGCGFGGCPGFWAPGAVADDVVDDDVVVVPGAGARPRAGTAAGPPDAELAAGVAVGACPDAGGAVALVFVGVEFWAMVWAGNFGVRVI